MTDKLELPFIIKDADPLRLPMARLAEYLTDLAKLFGSVEHVHFKGLRSGSTVLVSLVDQEVLPLVLPRIRAASRGEGEGEAAGAWLRINKRLSEDCTIATLPLPGAEIIEFPGSPKEERPIGPIRQPTTIQGRLVRLEGSGDFVGVGIEDEAGIAGRITIPAKLVPELGMHFQRYVRLSGTGRWKRSPNGRWLLERLDADAFEILEDTSLGDLMRRAREYVKPGSGVAIIDALKELGSA